MRDAGLISKNRCQHCGLPKKGHICQVKLNFINQKRAICSEVVDVPPTPVVKDLTPPQELFTNRIDLPVAPATVTQEQQQPAEPTSATPPMSVAPMCALPPHMVIERPNMLVLPTPSPILRTLNSFNFQKPEDESEQLAAESAGIAMGVRTESPRMLMVDIMPGPINDEMEGPPTPAAA